MSDAVAHTLDGCEVQPLGEELNPEKEELLVDMESLKEQGLDISNTPADLALTGSADTLQTPSAAYKNKHKQKKKTPKGSMKEKEEHTKKMKNLWEEPKIKKENILGA